MRRVREHIENAPFPDPHFKEVRKYVGDIKLAEIESLNKSSQIFVNYVICLYKILRAIRSVSQTENQEPASQRLGSRNLGSPKCTGRPATGKL